METGGFWRSRQVMGRVNGGSLADPSCGTGEFWKHRQVAGRVNCGSLAGSPQGREGVCPSNARHRRSCRGPVDLPVGPPARSPALATTTSLSIDPDDAPGLGICWIVFLSFDGSGQVGGGLPLDRSLRDAAAHRRSARPWSSAVGIASGARAIARTAPLLAQPSGPTPGMRPSRRPTADHA